MPDPWDIPPFPEIGDDLINKTWAAVGLALSQWELLELALATLRKFFLASIGDKIVFNYDDDVPLGFLARADEIERAAHSFFRRNPSQDNEAEFEALIYEARKLALRRNDIAHGVVVGSTKAGDAKGFYLTPALHVPKRYRGGRAAYQYTSHEMLSFAESFNSLTKRVWRFADKIQAIVRASLDIPPGLNYGLGRVLRRPTRREAEILRQSSQE